MKKHTYLLLGIALTATASAATPSLKENLSEALYTESVLRDPGTAAGMFAKVVESYRDAGSPAELSQHAATALFRLAEIREGEGEEEEAKDLYREFLDQFPKHQPHASLAQRKLGLGAPDSQGVIMPVEGDGESFQLSERVYRKSWMFHSELKPGELLLTTFRVSHREGYANEGLPPAFETTTLHHVPSGQSAHSVSRTFSAWPKELLWMDDGEVRWERRNFITAFGQSFEVPEGLVWTSDHKSTLSIKAFEFLDLGHSMSMSFNFANPRQFRDKIRDKNEPAVSRIVEATKSLTVELESRPVSLKKAMSLMEASAMKLPDTGDVAWSVTVPPSPAQLEELNKGN
jgi:hypothetical protein